MLFPRLTGANRTLAQTVAVVAVMVGLAFASVPFYSWFCRVTGFSGYTNVAAAGSDTILDQTIKVRFDASLDRDMPWTFTPVQREMTLRLGETGLAFYEAHNPTDRVVSGQAAYNVTPYEAGGFSIRSNASALPSKPCSPEKRYRCPSAFMLIRQLSKTAMRSMSIRSHWVIPFTRLTHPKPHNRHPPTRIF